MGVLGRKPWLGLGDTREILEAKSLLWGCLESDGSGRHLGGTWGVAPAVVGPAWVPPSPPPEWEAWA